MGTGYLLLGPGAKTVILNTKALSLMAVSQGNALLFCHRASDSQDNLKMSISGSLPRTHMDLGSTLPFLFGFPQDPKFNTKLRCNGIVLESNWLNEAPGL